jgi:hypothetical protein
VTENVLRLGRFVVRQGTSADTWMVWDRKTRGPAKVAGRLAVGYSDKDRARQVCDRLELEHCER